MLQSNFQRSERIYEPSAKAPSSGGIGEMVGFGLSFVRRRLVMVLLTAAVALVAAVVYLRVTPPTYVAGAQVLLDSAKSQYTKESPLADQVLDFAQIETQMQILRSPATAIAVIKQLNLADDPDLNRRPISISMIWGLVRDRIWPPKAVADDAPIDSTPPQLGAFLDRMTVQRVGFGNIVEVDFSSSSSARAAEIANAVANAYVEGQANSRSLAGRRATDWLQERLQSLGDQARTAEIAADTYKTKHNIVSSGGKSIDEQQVTDLNTRLIEASTKASDAMVRLNRFEGILQGDWKNGPTADTMGAALSESLSAPIINNLRTQYLELQRKESEYSVRYGPNHQAVVDLRLRMRDLRSSIRDEVQRLAETSRNEYDVASKSKQAIEKLLDQAVTQSRGVDLAGIELQELDNRAKDYRNLYQTFQQRYVGALQLESFPISDAQVISPALPPTSKSKPKSALALAMGIFGGLALGVGLGLLKDLMDGVFRTSAQVEKALNISCLSLVPLMRKPKRFRSAKRARSFTGAHERLVQRSGTIDAEVTSAPVSHFVEALRTVKMQIDFCPGRTNNKVIGITSAMPNEGKTTIAASLARLMAHGGKRVIVVDCDLRNPSLSADFAPDADFGFVEVADGRQAIDDVVWKDPTTNLTILPAVRRRQIFHTSETLAAESTRALFERLREAYDYVIVDLPPLLPLVDTRATSSFIDCFVLVIDWGRTKVDVVQHALRTAPGVEENVIGAVLNKTDMGAIGNYDHRSRSLYHEKQYSRYI